jgi:hypothetical protein
MERFYITDPKGHEWQIDEDTGMVDIFAFDVDGHNGPLCVKCGYAFCHHCKTEIKPCTCK